MQRRSDAQKTTRIVLTHNASLQHCVEHEAQVAAEQRHNTEIVAEQRKREREINDLMKHHLSREEATAVLEYTEQEGRPFPLKLLFDPDPRKSNLAHAVHRQRARNAARLRGERR